MSYIKKLIFDDCIYQKKSQMKVMIEETGENQKRKDLKMKDLHEKIILMRKNWTALKNLI